MSRMTLGRRGSDGIGGRRGSPAQRRPEQASGKRHRLLATGVLILFVVPAFSGCMTLEELFEPRPSPVKKKAPGEVRIWIAAKPGGLPPEFHTFNITIGTVAIMERLAVQDPTFLRPVERTVDLAAVEREKGAVLVGRATPPSGTYQALVMTVVGAELGRERVVGNHDGEPVKKTETEPIGYNPAPMTLQVFHGVERGSITDLFIEYDLLRTLDAVGNGIYEFTHGVHGVAVYADGVKIDHYDVSGRDVRNAQSGRYGNVEYEEPREFIRTGPSPNARIKLWDAWNNDLTLMAGLRHRVPRAIGLDEPLTFDIFYTVGNTFTPDIPDAKLSEVLWDFGDGTRSRAHTVTRGFAEGGVYDVMLTTRDVKGRVNSDFMTFFVPYRPDEAIEVRTEARAGTLAPGLGPAGEVAPLATESFTFTFPEAIAGGVFALGGYRVRLTFHPPALEDEDRFLGLTQMQLNVTSGNLDVGRLSSGAIELATGGIPVERPDGALDWVQETINVDLRLAQGASADYALEVEALYFPDLAEGRDNHGQHRHGAFGLFEPYYGHLALDGSNARPLPGEVEDEDA